MDKRRSVEINSAFLKARCLELKIKQWWLADTLGVNTKTIRRWQQGSSRRIHKDYVDALLEILSCQKEELLVDPRNIHFPSEIDRLEDTESLLNDDQMMISFANDERWLFLHRFIRLMLHPYLPKELLARAQCQLALSLFYLDKWNESVATAQKAKSLGIQLGLPEVVIKANSVLIFHHQSQLALNKAELLIEESHQHLKTNQSWLNYSSLITQKCLQQFIAGKCNRFEFLKEAKLEIEAMPPFAGKDEILIYHEFQSAEFLAIGGYPIPSNLSLDISQNLSERPPSSLSRRLLKALDFLAQAKSPKLSFNDAIEFLKDSQIPQLWKLRLGISLTYILNANHQQARVAKLRQTLYPLVVDIPYFRHQLEAIKPDSI